MHALGKLIDLHLDILRCGHRHETEQDHSVDHVHTGLLLIVEFSFWILDIAFAALLQQRG